MGIRIIKKQNEKHFFCPNCRCEYMADNVGSDSYYPVQYFDRAHHQVFTFYNCNCPICGIVNEEAHD